ncbi:hypothetical protein GJ496_005865 [Pomphorhynchus laevis]|nr:hypothetical protein GJ496_005865 [Pomphorhynchus laevis]
MLRVTMSCSRLYKYLLAAQCCNNASPTLAVASIDISEGNSPAENSVYCFSRVSNIPQTTDEQQNSDEESSVILSKSDEARYLQHTKDGKGNYQVEENWHKTFNIGGAVRTLDGKASFGKCLKLNEKVGQLAVKQALSEKHPHGENLHEEGLIKHSMIGTLPFHVTLFNQITGADIVSMAKKTTGAAMPSDVDAQWLI